MSFGYDESYFWDSTPRQISNYFKAAQSRFEREYNRDMQIAWTAARLGMADPKKFPKLRSLLIGQKAPKRQTQAEMLDALKALAGMSKVQAKGG